MGLDMYLKAKTYVNKHNWKVKTDDEQPLVTQKFKDVLAIFPELNTGDIYGFEVSRVLGYWRKANAIHNWFVQNVQNGTDECQESYVAPSQLEELRDTIDKVLADPKLADELLPTRTGCFFGSQEYDDWYVSDLLDTKTIINNLLDNKELDRYDFYYQASW
jgi:hypothetical protein